MTTLAARLVKEGKIRYDTTLAEVFPAFADQMNPQYRTATLDQLLTHRAGIIPYFTPDEVAGYPYSGTLRQQRRLFTRNALKLAPAAPIGTFSYSYAGPIIAGAMLEAVTDQDFQVLVQTRIYNSFGGHYFPGYPRDNGANQPIGHEETGGSFVPSPTTSNDIFAEPSFLGSSSAADFGRFVQLHLRGLEGLSTNLLSASEIQHLHPQPTTADPDAGQAYGWESFDRQGIPTVVTLSGDGLFNSIVYIQPTRGVAAFAVTNAGGDVGFRAMRTAALRLMDLPIPAASVKAEVTKEFSATRRSRR
jgi:CubicO group peptidase (beta-lactamase class C family)